MRLAVCGRGGIMVKDFSRTLSLLRQEKKISQRKAAGELGVSQALLSHYENGIREPGLSFVVRAADYYGVSCDYLLGRTMSREGNTIAAEDVPDMSAEKDNVLRGSAMALLSKKLIVNTSSLLLDLVGKSDCRQLTQEVTSYLFLALYKAYRLVYMASGVGSEATFSVPVAYFSELCDAEMKLCERRLRELSSPENKKRSLITLPDMTIDGVQQAYPMLAPSLFSVLHTVASRLENLEQKK